MAVDGRSRVPLRVMPRERADRVCGRRTSLVHYGLRIGATNKVHQMIATVEKQRPTPTASRSGRGRGIARLSTSRRSGAGPRWQQRRPRLARRTLHPASCSNNSTKNARCLPSIPRQRGRHGRLGNRGDEHPHAWPRRAFLRRCDNSIDPSRNRHFDTHRGSFHKETVQRDSICRLGKSESERFQRAQT